MNKGQGEEVYGSLLSMFRHLANGKQIVNNQNINLKEEKLTSDRKKNDKNKLDFYKIVL